MSPPTLTREQSRQVDRRAMEEYGISGLVLMENAGRGVVDVLGRLAVAGSSFRVESAFIELNPAIPMGVMAASDPPATIRSASPR